MKMKHSDTLAIFMKIPPEDNENSHKEEDHKPFLKLQNNNLTFPIDIFVHIVDNYGDMGFAIEFIQACKNEFINQYSYIIWTDNVIKMQEFARQSGISDVSIVDIVEF